jgi:hypothetical protein
MANPYINTPAMTDASIASTNPEIIGLDRRKKMAELLIAQGAEGQPQGQMISGYYVAPSWAQRLNPVLNNVIGQSQLRDVESEQSALAEALRKQEGEDLAKFFELQYGGKEMPAEAQAGPMRDGGNIPIETILSEANPQAAFELASKSRSPIVRAQLAEMLKGQKLSEGDIITRYNPMTGKTETVSQGGQKIDPDTRRAMQFLGINKPIDQLSPQELQAVENKAIAFKKAGANNISLNMPSETERKGGFMANILDRNLLQMQNALGVDPSAVKPNVPASIVEAIAGPNLLSRSITPAQRQIIEDSQLDVLDAALTLRTGAAYTREQLKGMRDTYFPKLGDKPPAIAAKNQRLETLLEGAYIVSGRATPQRVSAPNALPPAQPNVNKELNIPAAPKAPKFLGFE